MASNPDAELPASLTLDEAFRSAFYMVMQYLELEQEPSEDIMLLAQYLWSDPARWEDWQVAVQRAISDGGVANPDHDGVRRERPAMPYRRG